MAKCKAELITVAETKQMICNTQAIINNHLEELGKELKSVGMELEIGVITANENLPGIEETPLITLLGVM